MHRESLSLLAALILPLAGAVAFWPLIGLGPPPAALASPPDRAARPAALPGAPLPLPGPPPMPHPAAAGLWLNF
jgi:hypothetical protein